MRYVLIDESGRLHDPHDQILVFAAVVTRTLISLDTIISKARGRIPTKGKRKRERLSEIKFSLVGDRTRQLVLKEIAKRDMRVYILVVDKQGRSIKDTPENYALLVARLLKKVLRDNPKLEHILIDRHYTFITQREEFNTLLQEISRRTLFIEHLDSLQNPVISLPDFVAGALRSACVREELQWKKQIEHMILEEDFKTWRELKQKAAFLKGAR